MMLCEQMSCTGCGACAESCPVNCILMTPDQAGFLFPEIDPSKCRDCHICEKSCPVLNPLPLQKVQKVYAAWAKDDGIRTSSSSGGLFSVFAEYILNRNGAVNGVAFDSNLNLTHEIACTPGESLRFRGSKYVQSWTNGIYKKIKENLEQNKTVLFTGVPCQVAGLKAYLKKDYENLICCDIICHGVPSQKYLRYCLEETCPIPLSEISSIQFRDLKEWGDYRLRVISQNGRVWSASDEQNDYTMAFLAGAINNETCYHCHYACSERIGDISIGDFWGIGAWKKFKHDVKSGCSVLMVNSEKGSIFVESVSKQIFLEERSLREASRENHHLAHPITRPITRNLLAEGNWALVRRNYQTCPIRTSILKKICTLPYRIIRKIIRNVNFTKWG